MSAARAPAVRRGPASYYAGPGETIVEFSDGESGGLLSIRRKADGNLWVEVYREDADVRVRASDRALARPS